MIPRLLGLLLGAVLLAALFLPAQDPATQRLTLDFHPALEIMAVIAGLAALALWGRRPGRWPRWGLAVAILLLAVLQFAAAAVMHVLYRPLELYWDLPQVAPLLGVLVDAVGPGRGTLILGGVALGLAALLVAVAWLLNLVAHGLAPRRLALLVLVVAALLLPSGLLSHRGADAVAQQVDWAYRSWRVMEGHADQYAALLGAPAPAPTPLPGLKQQDVHLVFFESYGTTVLDQPRYRAVVQPALDRFAAETAAAGYHLLSSRILSPTFGGGSRLAHGTIDSGVTLDLFSYRLMVMSKRPTLAAYMKQAGYRAVSVQPGIKGPWPEGAFWGFDRIYAAADLGYGGPLFGWFGIPDQFTLAAATAKEATPDHRPLFAQYVLVSSHTPFSPVPPYLADWADAGRFASVPAADWAMIRAPPDWTHLEEPYLKSVLYDLDALAGWLARLPGDGLVIILGDHQPPAVTGAGEPWTVPIHVLSRDPDLVAPFAALGYRAGALPPKEAKVKGMASFLPDFLAGFAVKASPE